MASLLALLQVGGVGCEGCGGSERQGDDAGAHPDASPELDAGLEDAGPPTDAGHGALPTCDAARCVMDSGAPADPCASDNGGCDPLVSCTVDHGEVRCGDCPPGYALDGRRCADVDECAIDHGGCGERPCTNRVGRPPVCGPCPAFYVEQDGTCADIDECATDNGGCDPLRTCLDVIGGPASCGDCAEGFDLVGEQCVGRDECLIDHGGCDSSQTCQDTPDAPPSCGDCPFGKVADGSRCVPDGFECYVGKTGADVATGVFEAGDIPSLVGITCIDGILQLEDTALVDFAGLASLRGVTGRLNIVNNSRLTSLHGLEHLQHAGILALVNDPVLADISQLSQLERVDGDLLIGRMPKLPALAGLSALRTVAGDLRIYSCALLPDLAALTALTEVTKMLELSGDSLRTLSGVEQLRRVGSLSISGPVLESLAALSNLGGALANLSLDHLDVLTDLHGLEGIETLSGSLTVNACPVLPNLAPLAGLGGMQLSVLQLTDNAALTELASFAFESVDTLTVEGNPLLPSLLGLETIKAIKSASITGNAVLADLRGLDGVGEIGQLEIGDNPMLGTLQGLGAMHTASSVAIYQNLRLLDVVGLGALESTHSMYIHHNGNLRSLAGLAMYRTTEFLTIASNLSLHALGLDALQTANNLYIYDNRVLPTCQAEALATRLGEICLGADGFTCTGVCSCSNGTGACP